MAYFCSKYFYSNTILFLLEFIIIKMILEVSGGVLSSLIFDQLHTTSDQVFFNILYVHYMLHLFSVLY